MRFGFGAKRSTNVRSMIMKESIAYYVNNNNSMFSPSLDAPKAFDKVHICKFLNLVLLVVKCLHVHSSSYDQLLSVYKWFTRYAIESQCTNAL